MAALLVASKEPGKYGVQIQQRQSLCRYSFPPMSPSSKKRRHSNLKDSIIHLQFLELMRFI